MYIFISEFWALSSLFFPKSLVQERKKYIFLVLKLFENNLTENWTVWKNWNYFHHIFITWTLDKGPLIVLFFGTKTGVKNHLVTVRSYELHGSPWRSFKAVPSSCVTRVVAPATPRLFQTLSTGSQPGTILSCATGTLTSALHDFISNRTVS